MNYLIFNWVLFLFFILLELPATSEVEEQEEQIPRTGNSTLKEWLTQF